MIDKKLCDQVKFIRKKMSSDPKTGKPLTQVAFAKSLGKSPSIIAEIETYKIEPSKAVIKKIIEVYGQNVLDVNPSEDFLKEYDYSKERLHIDYPSFFEVKPKETETQSQSLTYQLQEQKAENDSLRKENERLKKENLRLFMELEKTKATSPH